jgi:serine/threonine protein kinase
MNRTHDTDEKGSWPMSHDDTEKADSLIGQVIQGRYRIMNLLGEGGMGGVYLAEQLSIERLVAVKVLHEQYARDEEFLARFRREAQQAAALNHHRVVTIYEFGQTEDGRLFIAMEYVSGQTLDKLVRRGPLPVKRAVALGIQLAEALQAVHRAGVIHRDVKPENIMVRGNDEIKLMDFGIARARDVQTQTRLTRTGLIIGTPEYIAPEQIEGGEVNERTDIYAWGIVLYEMLSGKPPFTAPTAAAMLVKHLQEVPEPLRKIRRGVAEEIERVVMEALEKDPRRRPQTMAEAITKLRTASEQVKLKNLARATAIPQSGGKERKRKALVRGVFLLAMIVVNVAVWVIVIHNGRTVLSEGSFASVPISLSTAESDPVTEKARPEHGSPGVTDPLHVGLLYLDQGRYADAIAALETATTIDPHNAQALEYLERAQRARDAELRIRRKRVQEHDQ